MDLSFTSLLKEAAVTVASIPPQNVTVAPDPCLTSIAPLSTHTLISVFFPCYCFPLILFSWPFMLAYAHMYTA